MDFNIRARVFGTVEIIEIKSAYNTGRTVRVNSKPAISRTPFVPPTQTPFFFALNIAFSSFDTASGLFCSNICLHSLLCIDDRHLEAKVKRACSTSVAATSSL